MAPKPPIVIHEYLAPKDQTLYTGWANFPLHQLYQQGLINFRKVCCYITKFLFHGEELKYKAVADLPSIQNFSGWTSAVLCLILLRLLKEHPLIQRNFRKLTQEVLELNRELPKPSFSSVYCGTMMRSTEQEQNKAWVLWAEVWITHLSVLLECCVIYVIYALCHRGTFVAHLKATLSSICKNSSILGAVQCFTRSTCVKSQGQFRALLAGTWAPGNKKQQLFQSFSCRWTWPWGFPAWLWGRPESTSLCTVLTLPR